MRRFLDTQSGLRPGSGGAGAATGSPPLRRHSREASPEQEKRSNAPASAARRLLLAGAALVGALPFPVAAQRVDENVVAEAQDAFGSNVGGEDLGVYGPFDVRGFSPTDAGNVRIEGLYIDRQAELTSRLVAGNRIRIGPSALGYAFPAPSGIADYRLRAPQEAAVLSVTAKADHFGGGLAEADALLPIDGARLGLAGGIGVYRNVYAYGNDAEVLSLALSGVWRPNAATQVQPYWSRIRIRDEEAHPIIQSEGNALPPRMKRRRFLGQEWADFEVERLNYGAVARTALAGFTLRAGLFRSANITAEGHTLLIEAAPPGVAGARTAIAAPPSSNASTSGEINAARAFATGPVRHELMLALRGRAQDRLYGGSDRRALTPAPFDEAAPVPRPDFAFSERTDDRVRQWTGGIAWRARGAGLGEINAGLQRSDYRKRVVRPDGALPDSRATPWLFNLAAMVEATARLAFYGGYTKGLEESDVAPEIAVNRDEAPPAIRTRQIDGGVQWRLGPMLLIAGAFEIEKPYYGLDTSNLFRRLGTVRHRGIEGSISGSPAPGLTLVAGGVLLDARISGEEVSAGSIGRRPIGTPSRTLIANLDWRVPAHDALSFDLAVEHRGRVLADAANMLRVPARTIVDLGARYRFRLGDAPAVLRLQATNLFDAYGWEVEGNKAFSYVEGRQLTARVTVDF
ncbi:TonB-dependent siderophore receptor [Sphingosinicella sp. CPCC 101087]|uniref:TonB-dependent siderophore receptor n=1 Tax=Sphingosinicella sp. CPCC 101087 TaxID=2497754 RepID=UPI00197D689A|nr:TonB-dependent receptor [Sphingosinicella sp. CPCC 101087]